MSESQNIEYKSTWHDDYLKWVCGFANAQGGVIFIGKDDNGNVSGIDDHKRLMDDIPNKIRNAMGITVEVNLHEESGKHFIEIITLPYSVPISLRGRYYYRSGSTKQELTGASLNEFLLKKSGKTWDDVIEPRATFDDIDEKAVATFVQEAEFSGRLPESKGLTVPQLFDKLRLTENGQLKRAAIVLFAKDPAKFYPNTFVKIGRFGKDDADLIFQENEEGNLIMILQTILEQLHHKFLIRKVSFEGMKRIETSEYPVPALREVILNALVHRNYMGAPTQIRVYDDKIVFWNEGTLPQGLSIEALKGFHASQPRNILIADVCFKGGYIDSWGRGMLKIYNACKEAGLPEPEIKEFQNGLLVTLFKNNLTEEQLNKLGLNERQFKAVEFVKENGQITNKEYQSINSISERTASRELSQLVEKKVLKSSETKGAGSYFYLP
ncbi:ATP-binding protein [Sinomicrobium soli]|uniref:ATP-binding protein n=1 Tax=Sinomicrobium sp. N-1-3-6 TaxID=2219864 RepID=UPI000DCB32CF|nr:ATP-binding protein [Sinomicrobium sp. N-1-3-6]RAV28520.1 transcriptional regulator [Sinomicrobium sp. N-1-3-6]